MVQNLLMGLLAAVAAEAYNPVIPVLVDRPYNIVTELKVEVPEAGQADYVDFRFEDIPVEAVESVRLMYSGASSALVSRTGFFPIRWGASRWGGGQQGWCHPSYVIERARVRPESGSVRLQGPFSLVKGKNYFYVSMEVASEKVAQLSKPFQAQITAVQVNGAEAALSQEGPALKRLGVSVRNHGDEGVDSYRIPGLATTKKGTLVAVYDIRYHYSNDLQDDIDIGVSRSRDGGKTWGKMQIAMDMGEYGGLPEGQNGVGDPAVLVDENTGDILIVAAWTHGHTDAQAWFAAQDGLEPISTPQLMMVRSTDDGETWSAPVNLTSQTKRPEWFFSFQGPGRGITMEDGTLVFAYQHQAEGDRIPWSGIMYSRDHGQTWHVHEGAKSNTTEAQVAEIEPGVLMLNMRDNRKTGRAVYTTEDLGRTWKQHPSDARLQEPVCMASLLNVKAEDNVTGRDILLFSNPNTTEGRHHTTIKASLDKGLTWLPEHQVLLDEEPNWGYSCLTLVDRETVGILYEGSTSQLVFQAVSLSDILNQ